MSVSKKISQNIFKKLFCPIDINEDNLYNTYPELLKILLKDMTTGKNIIWATDDYIKYGIGYEPEKEITPQLITGKNVGMIKPRVKKSRTERERRTKEKAEVFTPSWVCNKQNNLVDNEWFGIKNVFNKENNDNTWKSHKRIQIPKTKKWEDYVTDIRMEITCGEAPYLVSRYDTVTGKKIELNRRIGLLDRKMRIIKENVSKKSDYYRIEWLKWAKKAFQSIYGYDFQGDNVLLAREALLASFCEYYIQMNFETPYPSGEELKEIAEVISWNIWQMDGLTYMVPFEKNIVSDMDSFDFENGGQKDSYEKLVKIMDWEEEKTVIFKFIGDSNE